MIQIAVLGYGTVGSGVVEVINRNQESINKKAGEEINIKYVIQEKGTCMTVSIQALQVPFYS